MAHEHPALPRRALMQGLAAAGVAGGSVPLLAGPARAATPDAPPAANSAAASLDWAQFDRQVRMAFDRMRLVGTAIAVVSADRVLHTLTLGSRSISPRRPVTERTAFRVGSTTKGMTAALLATYVDEGRLAWDQPVVDAWSGFRAPTDALTRSLRVRDLLGMASGLGEPPMGGDLHLGVPTAAALVHGVAGLPVISTTGAEFYYNNSINAVGGYLPLLAAGVAPVDLPQAYARAMHERVYAPAGMTRARLGDDPRGLVDDYATGYEFDLRGQPTSLPYGAVGAHAPAGATLADVTDMAAWVRLQLRQGVSVTGGRVVSAANLAETWRPGVSTPFSLNADPDAVSQHYALGWERKEFTDGSSLVWHDGAIEGFTSFVGFVPQHDIGLVVLNNINYAPNGIALYTYVRTLVLDGLLGLNHGATDKALAFSDAELSRLESLGREARPVAAKAVEPHLGYYADGYSLLREGRDLVLRVTSRVMPLLAMPDGTYLVTRGLIVGSRVRLGTDLDGVPHLELVGLQTVRRVTGPT